MIRAGLVSLLVLALLAGIGACDGGEIVVFSAAGAAGDNAQAGLGGGAGAGGDGFAGSSITAGNGGTSGAGSGGSDAVGTPCQSSDDCDLAWYCQKQTCADATGVCNPVPLSDDPVRAEVCGCDSITYWNDTLRQQNRNSSSTIGACKIAVKPCLNDHDCLADPDARCARRLGDFNGCSMPGTGQCWVVPSECPDSDEKPDLLPCPPPGPPGSSQPPSCLTLCQAINSGFPFFKNRMDNVCL
jgi:hypothetical protein